MSLVECPHCLANVLPMKDGACPSCLKSTRTPNTNPFTRLVVTEDTRFPKRCCACGQQTEHRTRIVGEGYGADPLWVRLLAGAAMLLHPHSLAAHHKELRGNPELLRIEVPYCPDCRKKGPLKPEYINTSQLTVELKVIRVFAEDTRALNPTLNR